MNVIFYDQYYDIPLRGLLLSEGRLVPFTAEVNQNSPEEWWSLGIPANVMIFPEVDELASYFQLISNKFEDWKSNGSLGAHPIVNDANYQKTVEHIDLCFSEFTDLGKSNSGLFSNDGSFWNFRPILNDNDIRTHHADDVI